MTGHVARQRALTIQLVKLRRLVGRWDAWLDASAELIVGCIILVLSGSFWTSADSGAIWGMHHWAPNVGAILGPLFIYRAWRRRRTDVRCGTCGERVDVIDVQDEAQGFLYYAVNCPSCGPYALERVRPRRR